MSSFERDRRLLAARAYVLSNIDKPISLESAAQRAGLSTCYFSRLFHKTEGARFSDWLASQRVRKAQRLIASRNSSITDISYAVGFGSVSSMERAFKKHAGCTPRSYRSKAKADTAIAIGGMNGKELPIAKHCQDNRHGRE